MAGHSHSANIRHHKNAVDAKKGQLFSKLARAVIVAARQGGGDPGANSKLKLAIEKAKAANMTRDGIERAIRRGTGDGDDARNYEELLYEGYGAGGVALLVSCLTDNRNRTAPDVKHIFDRHSGNLGSSGSVSFLFEFRSQFVAEREGRDEDALMEMALDAGASDVELEDDYVTIFAPPIEFVQVKQALEGAGLKLASAETAYVPLNWVQITDRDEARRVLRLVEALEENEDVQSVYANYDIPEEWLEEL